MSGKKWLRGAWTLAWAVAMAATAAAAGPEAVGSLVGSRNATLDGKSPLAHTVLLSGDQLAVNDGLAMVTLDRGNCMYMGEDSEASFFREAKTLTVLVARGNLSLYHPKDGSGLRVKAGDVTVVPAEGGKVLGEIAVADGVLVVTVNEGSVMIEMDGTTSEVAKGHTMTIGTAARGAAASVSPSASPSALPAGSYPKHVLNHRPLAGFRTSAGDASAAAMAIGHHHHRHVSPIHPGD
jgi:hypothetical protein